MGSRHNCIYNSKNIVNHLGMKQEIIILTLERIVTEDGRGTEDFLGFRKNSCSLGFNHVLYN